jgi:heptosyltransferase-1
MARVLRRAGGRGQVPPRPRRILLVAIHYLGDSILTVPLLDGLRRHWPEARIDVWCAPRCRALFADLAARSGGQVIVSAAIPSDRIREPGRPWRERLALLAGLRAAHHDLLVDASGVPGTTGLAVLAGAACTAGWSAQGLEAWYDVAVQHDVPGEHLLERRRRLGLALGLDLPPGEAPQLPGAVTGGNPGGPILLHVGAGWVAKRWPPDRWGALAREIAGDARLPAPLLTGGPGEAPLLAAARAAAGSPAVDLCPATTLPELRRLLVTARQLVVADSGPAHLAAALGVPVLALFGPTDPARCGPLGDHAWTVRSPTGVMADLPPADVLAALRRPR